MMLLWLTRMENLMTGLSYPSPLRPLNYLMYLTVAYFVMINDTLTRSLIIEK